MSDRDSYWDSPYIHFADILPACIGIILICGAPLFANCIGYNFPKREECALYKPEAFRHGACDRYAPDYHERQMRAYEKNKSQGCIPKDSRIYRQIHDEAATKKEGAK